MHNPLIYLQITPIFGILMTVGCAMAIVFLSISAYFCIRRRTRPNNPQNSVPNQFQVQFSTQNQNPNIVIRENILPSKMAENSPDLVPTQNQAESGGFEIEGDKTKFATLQRQRKQIYDEIRDSKCRVQSLRRNLLSPTQFEGSAEKLLSEMENGSPQHQFYASTFASSSGGRPSPCSTPTPPPYNRGRLPGAVGSPVLGHNQVKFRYSVGQLTSYGRLF